MGRYRHHGPFAISHQHVVGDPDRHRFLSEGMLHKQPGGHALLFLGGHIGLGDRATPTGIDEVLQGGIACSCQGRERMLGGDGHIGDAHQRVGARGEDLEPRRTQAASEFIGIRKHDLHAATLADPVALHGTHLLRPCVELLQIVQQFLSIAGDCEVIHRDLALLDQCAGTPATPVDDLLIGEHGLIDRVPVHHAGFPVDHPFLEQARKQPLFPAVIGRIAGGNLPFPVVGEPQALELALHLGDVFPRPARGRLAVFQRRIFGGEAKRIPAHRLQHVLAAHALVARDHIPQGVVAHMPHVQAAGGIGKHRQAVEFLPPRHLAHPKRRAGFPCALHACFQFLRLIFPHCCPNES